MGHFGRAGATVLKALSDHVQLGCEKGLQRDLREGLEWALCFLPVSPPRVISSSLSGQSASLFTDGAVDAGRVTVGAVLFLLGSPPEAFGVEVPREVVSRWRTVDEEQVIAQAELLPVLLSLLVWRGKLAGRYAV